MILNHDNNLQKKSQASFNQECGINILVQWQEKDQYNSYGKDENNAIILMDENYDWSDIHLFLRKNSS